MATDVLVYLSLKYDGNTDKIKEAVEKEEMFTQYQYNSMIKNQQYKCIDFTDFIKQAQGRTSIHSSLLCSANNDKSQAASAAWL